jgi:rhodanese-related sulfurtransferase
MMTLNRRTFLTTALIAPLPLVATGRLWAKEHDIWSVQEIHDALNDNAARLIDIRRPDEWRETGVAQGAWPIDMTDAAFWERLFAAHDLADGQPVALICAIGGRSGYIMGQLRQRQFTGFVDVAGGMMGSRGHPGWIASGLPVVTSEVALAALPTSLI